MNNLRVKDRVKKAFYTGYINIFEGAVSGVVNFKQLLADFPEASYVKVKSISVQWNGSYEGNSIDTAKAVNVFGAYSYGINVFGRNYAITAVNSIGPDAVWTNRNKEFFYHGFIPVDLRVDFETPFGESILMTVLTESHQGDKQQNVSHAFRVDVEYEVI